jgi:hypothetical protein
LVSTFASTSSSSNQNLANSSLVSSFSSQNSSSFSNSQSQNTVSIISSEDIPEKFYYKGKIGDLPIRMILEYYFYRGNYGLAHGKYLYEKKVK